MCLFLVAGLVQTSADDPDVFLRTLGLCQGSEGLAYLPHLAHLNIVFGIIRL
jgi:hypothetical protein